MAQLPSLLLSTAVHSQAATVQSSTTASYALQPVYRALHVLLVPAAAAHALGSTELQQAPAARLLTTLPWYQLTYVLPSAFSPAAAVPCRCCARLTTPPRPSPTPTSACAPSMPPARCRWPPCLCTGLPPPRSGARKYLLPALLLPSRFQLPLSV